MPSIVFKIIVVLSKVLLPSKTLAQQARQPTGFLGKYLLQPMFVKGNADLNAFMLDGLKVQPKDKLLEIGFGPGELLKLTAQRLDGGKIHGLDFSSTMLEAATQNNKMFIESDCMQLQQGCSSEMPYADDCFDKVVTGNTLYFWQPPKVHLDEVFRVLKSGGVFVMGFRDQQQIDVMQLDEEVFARYSCEQVVELLEGAGFTEVSIQKRSGMPVDSYVSIARKK